MKVFWPGEAGANGCVAVFFALIDPGAGKSGRSIETFCLVGGENRVGVGVLGFVGIALRGPATSASTSSTTTSNTLEPRLEPESLAKASDKEFLLGLILSWGEPFWSNDARLDLRPENTSAIEACDEREARLEAPALSGARDALLELRALASSGGCEGSFEEFASKTSSADTSANLTTFFSSSSESSKTGCRWLSRSPHQRSRHRFRTAFTAAIFFTSFKLVGKRDASRATGTRLGCTGRGASKSPPSSHRTPLFQG
mmetsp:Transcript_15616/g.36864  ORF Transcript_15616/g.36864 Transcript_15616/m.36864 type:complete len:257 (-) Transcript_15616:104-874(-)